MQRELQRLGELISIVGFEHSLSLPLRIYNSVHNKFNCRNKGASMQTLLRALYSSAAILVFAMATYIPAQAQKRIEDRFATVNGVRLHYLIAGKGDPVILLHGYAENSHMWRPLMPELAKTHTVIAPDLRGFGQSAKPTGGYTKKAMAQDIHALAMSLGFRHETVVGHDIGSASNDSVISDRATRKRKNKLAIGN